MHYTNENLKKEKSTLLSIFDYLTLMLLIWADAVDQTNSTAPIKAAVKTKIDFKH